MFKKQNKTNKEKRCIWSIVWFLLFRLPSQSILQIGVLPKSTYTEVKLLVLGFFSVYSKAKYGKHIAVGKSPLEDCINKFIKKSEPPRQLAFNCGNCRNYRSFHRWWFYSNLNPQKRPPSVHIACRWDEYLIWSRPPMVLVTGKGGRLH